MIERQGLSYSRSVITAKFTAPVKEKPWSVNRSSQWGGRQGVRFPSLPATPRVA